MRGFLYTAQVMHPLILASASSGRKMLLEDLGIPFEMFPSDLNEDDHPEREPAARATILARLKALDVHGRKSDRWILGCDTLVVASDGTLLEKAGDEEEARSMMERQSGGASVVHSAACLVSPAGEVFEGLSSSNVHFAPLTSEVIDWWVKNGYWKGKSGAFQIGGPGALIIERIDGDWSGVVGLSIHLFGTLCKEAGFPLLEQIQR